MASAADQKVEFSGRVPLSTYNRFMEHFSDGKGKPIYGATTWFITTSLDSFLDQIESNPSLKQQVVAGIKQMLESNRTAEV